MHWRGAVSSYVVFIMMSNLLGHLHPVNILLCDTMNTFRGELTDIPAKNKSLEARGNTH